MRVVFAAILVLTVFSPVADAQVFVEGNSGTTPATLTISRPSQTQGPITGTWFTTDGTASAADNDFTPTSGGWTIGPNENATTVTVFIVGDTRVEGDETFTINLTNTQPSSFPVTIINDDVNVSVVDETLQEGNSGAVAMTFKVTVSPALTAPATVTVSYQTEDITATAGVDYQAASGTLTFTAGQTSQVVTVNLIPDATFEPDETFRLVVSSPSSTATATGTIDADDVIITQRVTMVSGNNQQGRLGERLPEPLVIQVVEDVTNPTPIDAVPDVVAGLPVQWVVTRGAATLEPQTGVTDAQGIARTFVTPESVGEITIEARVAQLPPVVFTVNGATSFESRATGPVAVPIARALDQICARNENEFNAVCRALSNLGNGALTNALERAAPQQSGAQMKIAGEVVSAITAGIGSRLSAVRSGERFSTSRLAFSLDGQSIPLAALASTFFPMLAGGSTQSDAGGGDESSGWGLWIAGNLGDGQRKVRPGELGFDLESRGLIFGVDKLAGSTVFGASLHLMQLDTVLSQDAGSVDTQGYAVSVYASRAGIGSSGDATTSGFDGIHLDGSLTLGRNTYESEHIVAIGPLPVSRATSENDANVLAFAAVAGIDAHRGRIDYDFSLGGTWSRSKVDDMTETGSGPLILFVQGYDVDSLTGNLSGNVRATFGTGFGTLTPNLRGEFVHEFEDGARLVTARFLRDRLGTGFTIPLDRPDANYARIGAGLQAGFPYGWSAYVSYTQDVARDDLEFKTVEVNVRKSF